MQITLKAEMVTNDPEARVRYCRFAGAIDAMLRAIGERRPVPVPGEEGRQSLELVLAAYQSVESDRSVPLPLGGR